jgi:twinkle protein
MTMDTNTVLSVSTITHPLAIMKHKPLLKQKLKDSVLSAVSTLLIKRRISESTCRKFGYRVAKHFDSRIQLIDVRDRSGRIVAEKCRTANKDFFINGTLPKDVLLGMHLWSGGRKIVITEGEIDMLSYAEIVNCKWPVVSLPTGASGARKVIRNCMDYLQKFDEVVLMFDMDEAGQTAVQDCLPLFKPNHVKIAKLPRKDANECLLEGEAQAVVTAVMNAEGYKPSQIVTIDDIYNDCLKEPEMGLSFPWLSATNATLGIRRGEIHIVGAAPKIGKTEHQHQLIQHMTDIHSLEIGVMSLEEKPVKTAKKIAGKYMKKQFTKPKAIGGWTTEELCEGLDTIKGKMQLYSSEGVRDFDEILNTVRWWAASGIWFFIVDPLTALVAEHDSSTANDMLNEFMSRAASMCLELDITFFMYTHVNPAKHGKPHDEGGRVLSSQFTGSRAMEKWAHYGWGIWRNRNEPDPTTRNTATVGMLFDREFGEWCEYSCFYDSEKNDWSECAKPEENQANPFTDNEEF